MMPIKGLAENLENLLGMVVITRFIRITDGVESRTVEAVRTVTCEIKTRKRWSRPSREEQRRKSDLLTVFVLPEDPSQHSKGSACLPTSKGIPESS